MSIISKLPCRRFKLGINSFPSISSSLTYENRKRHQKYGDPRNHFHVLSIFYDESSKQNSSKATSIHANKFLCHPYFRRGMFESPQFKEDRPEPADQEVYSTSLNRDAKGRFGFSVSLRKNCEIDGITKGSPAEKSDLKVGDVIIAINYQKVKTTKQIVELMGSSADSIEVKFCKKGTLTPTEGKVDKDLPKPLKYSLAFCLYGIIGFIIYKVNEYKKKRDWLKKDISEYLPKDIGYHANFPLVRYLDCVLPEDMIMSGTMKQVQNFKAGPDDVIIASFPKSGTTWVQEIVHQISMIQASKQEKKNSDVAAQEEVKESSLSNVAESSPSVDLTDVVFNNSETMELRVPYLENGYYPGIKDIEKRKGRRLIKTHLPSHILPSSAIKNKTKIIYIYRNPKDVMVSYYHFARMLKYMEYRGTLLSFIRSFKDGTVPYAPYFPHIDGYMKLKEENPDDVLIVTYENIKANPKDVIRSIASFIRKDDLCELDENEIEAIQKLTTFEAMKNDPRTNYSHWDTFGIRNQNESKFMRAGEVGDYQKHLHPETDEKIEQWIKKESSKLQSSINFKFKVE